MKLDYDCILRALKHVEGFQTDGGKTYAFPLKNIGQDITERNQLIYHYRLLIEEGMIQGKIYRSDMTLSRLTLSGHQLLESLEKESLRDQIKDKAKDLGIEGLKEIPALAIDLLR